MVYEFSWANYFRLFENPLAKSSLLFSVAGYMIYLNDFVAGHIDFSFITSNTVSVLGFDTKTKLYLIYFGLLFLGLSRLVFLAGRPNVIKFGPTQFDWVNFGLREFTFFDFQRLNGEINENGHRTIYGKYYDDDWDSFRDDATWKESGRTHGQSDDKKRYSRRNVSFAVAKQRHEDLLRSILIDRYAEYSATNKPALALAFLLAMPGYILFLLPNLDLTLTLLVSIFK